jgi:dihydrofolate reductase
MSKVKVLNFTISSDGYGAGPNQSMENPLGVGAEELHNWMVKTATFRSMYGEEGGDEGIDNDFTVRGMHNNGAWILGRNMFTLSRGAWPDDGWKGWWGDNPPYHAPVFVLTHHPRASIPMEGGTTFHFVTEGIHAALERAREAAGEKDIRILGGVNVIRQYLRERVVDEMHVPIAPIALGSGEHLYKDLNLLELGYKLTEHVSTPDAMHLVFTKAW